MLAGTLLLELAIIWFMLAKPFWCLVLRRVLQGMASGIVWVVGLAFLNENISKNRTGLCIRLCMTGTNIGEGLGPALGE